jgi:hypothetical protein
MRKMNEEFNLEYVEMKVTGKTVLFIREESKTLHKLKPQNHIKEPRHQSDQTTGFFQSLVCF